MQSPKERAAVGGLPLHRAAKEAQCKGALHLLCTCSAPALL